MHLWKCEHLQVEIDHNTAKNLEENMVVERVTRLEKGKAEETSTDVEALIAEVVKELDERQSEGCHIVVYGWREADVDADERGRDENVAIGTLLTHVRRCNDV